MLKHVKCNVFHNFIIKTNIQFFFTDFQYGYGMGGLGLAGFNPFMLTPAGWLDAAYMGYASWPDYLRPTVTSSAPAAAPPAPHLPLPPPAKPTPPSIPTLPFHAFLPRPPPLLLPPQPSATSSEDEEVDVVKSAFRPPPAVAEPDSTVQEPTPQPVRCELKAKRTHQSAPTSPSTKLHTTTPATQKAHVWRPY